MSGLNTTGDRKLTPTTVEDLYMQQQGCMVYKDKKGYEDYKKRQTKADALEIRINNIENTMFQILELLKEKNV